MLMSLKETFVKIFTFIVAATIIAALSGCGGQANSNVANTNTNAVVANANKVEPAPTPSDQASATGSLATPSEAYRTAYAYREKKDLAGMKRVLSKDVMEFLTMMGEDEKKSLDDQISEIFLRPQAKTAETRNEKIKGDRATIEYLDEKGGWTTMDFVKEGQDWKMALPDKDDIKIETGAPGKKAP